MTDRAFLFIGFQMDDWNFRVLFRYIMSKLEILGTDRQSNYAHVAVQITPEEGNGQSPES
jgi:hypothetical protein